MQKTIKDIRTEKRISQKELAAALNISAAYLNKIENGKRKINVRLKTRISTILDCTNADILDK